MLQIALPSSVTPHSNSFVQDIFSNPELALVLFFEEEILHFQDLEIIAKIRCCFLPITVKSSFLFHSLPQN